MRCQPESLGLFQRAPAACRVRRRIPTAPAGRTPRHWRGGLVAAAAADEGAAAARAGAASQRAARRPATAPKLFARLRLRSVGPSLFDTSQRSCQARPGATVWPWLGPPHHPSQLSGQVFVQPGAPLPLPRQTPHPRSELPHPLLLLPLLSAPCRSSHRPPPCPSAGRHSIAQNATQQLHRDFNMLHAAFVHLKEAARQKEAALRRKLEEAERRAAQQRKAAPAPLPQQQPARAPAQRPAPPVWDSATAQASPTAAMSRLRAAEASAAAAKAWATTAAAHEAAAAAATERASSLPAAQHTAGAEEWEWAAAAWQAAYAALEAARQACPDAPAVRQAEAAVAAAAALRGMQQGWCGGDDAGDQV